MVNEEKQAHPEVGFPPAIHVTGVDTSTDDRRMISSGYAYLQQETWQVTPLYVSLLSSLTQPQTQTYNLCAASVISAFIIQLLLWFPICLFTQNAISTLACYNFIFSIIKNLRL